MEEVEETRHLHAVADDLAPVLEIAKDEPLATEEDPMPVPLEGETDEQYQARLETRFKVDAAIVLVEGFATEGSPPDAVSAFAEDAESAQETPPLDWWIESLPEAIRENLSKPAWHITGPDTAAWAEERFYEIFARKKVNELQGENAIALLEAEIERIKRRNEERNKPFINALNFFGGHLMDYALRLRQQDDSVKSWKGLYLTIGTRASAEKFEITDKEAFNKWLTDNGKADWYKLEIKPVLASIKKEVAYQDSRVIDKATGEVIAGLTGEPAKINAKIEVEEEIDGKGNPVLHPVRQLYVLEEAK
jgi:hypothetical protein